LKKGFSDPEAFFQLSSFLPHGITIASQNFIQLPDQPFFSFYVIFVSAWIVPVFNHSAAHC